MYWCNDCMEAYPDSDLEVIDMSEDETWTQCSYCGSTDIDKADRCRCGNYKNVREDLCDECKEYLTAVATDAVKAFTLKYKNSFWEAKEELKTFLDELYGR